MDKQSLFTLLLLAPVVAVISTTITRSSVFHPLRKWMLEHNHWIGKLITCPYCTAHWVSFVIVALYRPRIVHSGWWPVDLLLSAFALVALAMPIAFVVYRSFLGMPQENNEEVELLRAALEKAKGMIVAQQKTIKGLSAQSDQ
jgi:hypothetical protein